MSTDVAFVKLNEPEGIDGIWLEDKKMVTDVAEGKLKEPDGMDVIWLENK